MREKCEDCEKKDVCENGINLGVLDVDHFLWPNILHEMKESGINVKNFQPDPDFCNVKSNKERLKNRKEELEERKKRLERKKKKIRNYIEETILPEKLAKVLKRGEIKEVKMYSKKVENKLDEYEKMGI